MNKLTPAMLIAASLGLDAEEIAAYRLQYQPPVRGWKHNPDRLAAALERRQRRQARNLRHAVSAGDKHGL